MAGARVSGSIFQRASAASESDPDSQVQEYESLEQENSSLKKEVGKLAEELKRLSEVLKAHEQICPLLHRPMNLVTMPRAADGITGCLPR